MPKAKTKKSGAGRLPKEMLLGQEKPSGIEGEEIDGGSHRQGGSQTARKENLPSSLDSDVERIRMRIRDRRKRRLE